MQIPAEAFVFGTVAVLRSWKGHLYLLEALQEIVQNGEPAFLLVVGEGPYRVVIEEKVREWDWSPGCGWSATRMRWRRGLP